MPRLRRSSCAAPGITRRRRGRGFQYLDPDGHPIDDPEVIERIAELTIPPAWRDVWICTDPWGHLQATGIDAAGRKQYLYHERWRAHRDRLKFDSMLAFGQALDGLRRRVGRDLRDGGSHELTRTRVLACSVRLLDLGFFRIGSEDYVERNESYGLTTMLRAHVSISGPALIFDFPAKSGRRRVQEITDPGALDVVAALKRRRTGSQLLAYRTPSGWLDLHAEDVNRYIKCHTGASFTAKDFRTWNATVLAALRLAAADPHSRSPAARDRSVTAAIKTVAAYLGNTPAVCRASYVDPRVIDRYHAGHTLAELLDGVASGPTRLGHPRMRRQIELAVIELLDRG